jgi:hypothetical protein
MIAHAGATFKVRGIHPLHRPENPSCLKICHKNLGIDNSSGASVFPAVEIELAGSANTCRRVFPTSNGVVRIEATAPDVAPAMKLSVKVAV